MRRVVGPEVVLGGDVEQQRADVGVLPGVGTPSTMAAAAARGVRNRGAGSARRSPRTGASCGFPPRERLWFLHADGRPLRRGNELTTRPRRPIVRRMPKYRGDVSGDVLDGSRRPWQTRPDGRRRTPRPRSRVGEPLAAPFDMALPPSSAPRCSSVPGRDVGEGRPGTDLRLAVDALSDCGVPLGRQRLPDESGSIAWATTSRKYDQVQEADMQTAERQPGARDLHPPAGVPRRGGEGVARPSDADARTNWFGWGDAFEETDGRTISVSAGAAPRTAMARRFAEPIRGDLHRHRRAPAHG